MLFNVRKIVDGSIIEVTYTDTGNLVVEENLDQVELGVLIDTVTDFLFDLEAVYDN